MLPILNHTSEDMLRYYHRAKLQWVRHLGEEKQLDFGVAIFNPALSMRNANQIYDAALPAGMEASKAIEEAEEFFASVKCPCLQWTISASERGNQLGQELEPRGFAMRVHEVMRLAALPATLPKVREDLQILPARASFRHAREIAERSASEAGEPLLAEASMLHLDDPQWDALIALKDGVVVGRAGVLSVGEVGLIENVFVLPEWRRKGVATTLVVRGIEICQRSLFRHVLLGVEKGNATAIALYERFGFVKVAEGRSYGRSV